MRDFNNIKDLACLICLIICFGVFDKINATSISDEIATGDKEYVVYNEYCGFDKASVNQLYNTYVQGLTPGISETEDAREADFLNNNEGFSDKESLPPHILRSIEYAEAFWSLHLPEFSKLSFRYFYKEIESAVKTEVLYQQDSIDNTIYIPSALVRVKDNIGLDRFPDGEIYINNLINWEDNCLSDGYNLELTQGIIQAIAKIIGLGSSLILDDTSQLYKFQLTRGISRYDSLIKSNDGLCLSDFKNTRGKPSAEITSYVTDWERKFYLDFPNQQISLPNNTCHNIIESPFSTLKDGVMSVLAYNGDLNCIGDEAYLVLQNLGWRINEFPINLSILQESESGIFSWFGEYEILRSCYAQNIENIRYSIDFPLKEGGMDSILFDDNNLSANLPDLDQCSIYEVNGKGFLTADLSAIGIVNGIEYKSPVSRLTFDMKPLIQKIDILDVWFTDEYYYNVKFGIQSKGGIKVDVYLEEDNSSFTRLWSFNGGEYIEDVIPGILGIRHAWLDFYVENKYGRSLKTIEFNQGGNIVNDNIPTGVENSGIDYDNIIIYDITGKIILNEGKMSDSDILQYIQRPGVYLIRYFQNGCPFKSKKVYIQ